MIKVAASRGFRFGWVWSRSTLVRRSATSLMQFSSFTSAAGALEFGLRTLEPLAAARALLRAAS